MFISISLIKAKSLIRMIKKALLSRRVGIRSQATKIIARVILWWKVSVALFKEEGLMMAQAVSRVNLRVTQRKLLINMVIL